MKSSVVEILARVTQHLLGFRKTFPKKSGISNNKAQIHQIHGFCTFIPRQNLAHLPVFSVCDMFLAVVCLHSQSPDSCWMNCVELGKEESPS